MGFGICGLKFGVWGLEFGIWSLGFGDSGFGIRVSGSGFRVPGFGATVRKMPNPPATGESQYANLRQYRGHVHENASFQGVSPRNRVVPGGMTTRSRDFGDTSAMLHPRPRNRVVSEGNGRQNSGFGFRGYREEYAEAASDGREPVR